MTRAGLEKIKRDYRSRVRAPPRNDRREELVDGTSQRRRFRLVSRHVHLEGALCPCFELESSPFPSFSALCFRVKPKYLAQKLKPL